MSIYQNKKIMFLTGTRADYGHQKVLIDGCIKEGYDVFIFITGMHLDNKYGKTVKEIKGHGYEKYYAFYNHIDDKGNRIDSMDIMLSKTIVGFSSYVKEVNPDLIVIYADRFEALAGAIVGSLSNILTVHVQAGDASGTIDNSMRHAISKLCHAHFCANKIARGRLSKMGENINNIFIIGTPGLDVLFSEELPSLENVKYKYDIVFNNYSILIFHPVITEVDDLQRQMNEIVESILESNLNYIIICPNNDLGSNKIFEKYKDIYDKDNIKIFTSIAHFDFLTLLRNANFIIGNSSCGIIEAPCYGTPTINIGSRQNNRTVNNKIINSRCDKECIIKSINKIKNYNIEKDMFFGDGSSSDNFLRIIKKESFWEIKKQKEFNL